MNKKKRDHISEIIFYLNRTIREMIYPIVGLILLLLGETTKLTQFSKMALYIIIPCIIIYSILSWLLKVYIFKETYIIVSEGIFARRSDRIPYENIKAVDTSSNMINQIMKVKKLSVELIGGEKFTFTVHEREVVSIQTLLQNKLTSTQKFQEDEFVNVDTGHGQKKKLIDSYVPNQQFSFIQYLCLSLGNLKLFVSSFSIVAVSLSFFFELKDRFQQEKSSQTLFDTIQGLDLTREGLVELVISCFILIVVAYFLSFIYIFITYGRFRLTSNSDSISISYGIFSKKDHFIPKKEIRSISIRQPFIYRMFGYAQITIDNIRESSKTILVNPIIKKTEVDEFIKEHLTEFEIIEIDFRPEKKALFMFIMKPIGMLVFLVLVLAYLYPPLIWLLLLLPFAIWNGYVNWKYSGISFRDDFTAIQKVKYFTVERIISKHKFIQSTSLSQFITMKKVGTYHLEFELHYENEGERFICKHIKLPNPEEFLHHSLK